MDYRALQLHSASKGILSLNALRDRYYKKSLACYSIKDVVNLRLTVTAHYFVLEITLPGNLGEEKKRTK